MNGRVHLCYTSHRSYPFWFQEQAVWYHMSPRSITFNLSSYLLTAPLGKGCCLQLITITQDLVWEAYKTNRETEWSFSKLESKKKDGDPSTGNTRKQTRLKVDKDQNTPLSVLEWDQLNVGLGYWGRLRISFFGGLLAITVRTSNKTCLCDRPHKGIEMDSMDFTNYDCGEFIFYFIQKGKQQLVNNPILPLYSHFQWTWQL